MMTHHEIWRFMTGLLAGGLLLLLTGPARAEDVETFFEDHVRLIHRFFETLQRESPPTVADLNRLFSDKQEFEPGADPDQPSRFLQCIKTLNPELFHKDVKPHVQSPPAQGRDYARKITVEVGTARLIFLCPIDGLFIREIISPGGQPYRQRLPECSS